MSASRTSLFIQQKRDCPIRPFWGRGSDGRIRWVTASRLSGPPPCPLPRPALGYAHILIRKSDVRRPRESGDPGPQLRR
jgi:hypothetical protein